MIADFLNYLHELLTIMLDYAMIVVYAKIVPDWYAVLNNFLIAGIFFGSAFLSATIAESRRHKMKFHFIFGLLAPYIYPLVLAFRLKIAQGAAEEEETVDELSSISNAMTARLKDIQDAQQRERDKKLKRIRPGAEHEVEEPDTDTITDISAGLQEEITEAEGAVFDRRFFQGLAVDSSGAKAGPFSLTLKTGARYYVKSITNIQSDLASFEIEVNGRNKSIRVKYDKIESFNKINS